MSREAQRLSTIENFRVAEVTEAYFYKPNPLYRPPQPWSKKFDPGFSYAKISLPKKKYASVDEALEAVREAFYVRRN